MTPLRLTSNQRNPCRLFAFTPAKDRQLRVFCNRGSYHHEAEWCEHIPHPIEATRGLVAEGDAYSPGWFEIPLVKGESAMLVATAEAVEEVSGFKFQVSSRPLKEEVKSFGDQLAQAVKAFVVRRGDGKTAIPFGPFLAAGAIVALFVGRALIDAYLGLACPDR